MQSTTRCLADYLARKLTRRSALSHPPNLQNTKNSTWISQSCCLYPLPSPFPRHTYSSTPPRTRLLLSSLMYERTSATTREAIKDANSRQHMRLNPHRPGLARLRHFPGPGDLIRDVLGRAGLVDIRETLKRSPHVNQIQRFARRMEIEYEPVSELSSISSAYSALFWDVNSNWIVVAFKGMYSESDLSWSEERLMHVQGLHLPSLMVSPMISTVSFNLT